MNTDQTNNSGAGAGTGAGAGADVRGGGSAETGAATWTAGIFDAASPGALVPDWHTRAPEPGRWEPYKGAKNVEELLGMAEKRVSDAQAALRGRNVSGAGTALSLPRPDKNAGAEVWRAWREAQGLPEKAEDYGIARPADFPEQLWSDEEAADFMRFAHENDVKPELVKAMVGWQQERARNVFADRQREAAASFAQLQAEEAAALTKSFGPRLDGTLRNLQAVAQASGARASWFDPQARDFAGVEMVQFFARMLERIPRGEDAMRQRMGAAQQGGQYDLAWAKAAIRHGHPDHEALTNPKHPRHAELTELRNAAYAVG